MQGLDLVRIFKNTKSTVSKTEGVMDGTRAEKCSLTNLRKFLFLESVYRLRPKLRQIRHQKFKLIMLDWSKLRMESRRCLEVHLCGIGA